MTEKKVTLHIPVEQYGFVAIESDGMSAEETAVVYEEYAQAFRPKAGLSDKLFNEFIDRQLSGEVGNHIEQYEAMNAIQKGIVQCLKRALKRLEARNN